MSIDNTERLQFMTYTLMSQIIVHLLGLLPGVLPRGLLAAPVPALLSLPGRALLVPTLPVSLRHRES